MNPDMGADENATLARVQVAARPRNLRLIRATVSAAAGRSGCSDQCLNDIVIAVDEACQNVIRHAYNGDPEGEIIVEVRREQDHLVIDVVDFADPVDVNSIRPRPLDELRPGGLGTHFIRECMDAVDFPPPPDGAGNLLRMRKRIT